MAECDVCGEHENMPYKCQRCGGTFCGSHRLPENHDCPGLHDWGDPSGVFDSGFDDSVRNRGGGDSGLAAKLGFGTGRTGVLGYFRGNMTYVFLGTMWIWWFLQWFVAPNFLTVDQWTAIFVLTPEHPLYVWTWVTSIFSHAGPGFGHIVGNSIVIFFFGRLVEDYVGSRDYTLLFLGSGALAGLGQIAIVIAQGATTGGVYGASGAGLAIMGVLTVLNPNLRVYLYFLLPIPIWVITGFYALISSVSIVGFGAGAGGIAQGAHLVGLFIGLAYGQYVKEKGVRGPSQLQFGGGGPGGPGGRRRY